ncbi:delta-type opioid receptor [Monodelphis domestica]|uniref:delta-type opioid receptor n=1 Tax=Monodelphis domestica TaxID=13616 RepID=UPI0024E1C565|nr:delta-type opioid receptor [Monodelphis domestica]
MLDILCMPHLDVEKEHQGQRLLSRSGAGKCQGCARTHQARSSALQPPGAAAVNWISQSPASEACRGSPSRTAGERVTRFSFPAQVRPSSTSPSLPAMEPVLLADAEQAPLFLTNCSGANVSEQEPEPPGGGRSAASIALAVAITALYSAVCVVGLLGNVLVMYGIVRGCPCVSEADSVPRLPGLCGAAAVDGNRVCSYVFIHTARAGVWNLTQVTTGALPAYSELPLQGGQSVGRLT